MKGIESNSVWYIRTQDTLADDDDLIDSILLPVDQITGIVPGGTTGESISTICIFFKKTNANPYYDIINRNGSVVLNCFSGKTKELMEDLANLATSGTGYVVLADDVAETAALPTQALGTYGYVNNIRAQ